MTRVMSVDPGGTTGFAFWDDTLSPGTTWEGTPVEQFSTESEAGLLPAAMYIERCIVEWQPDVVVCESFTITMNTLKKSRDGNTAIELIGVTRYLTHKHGATFVLQSPADKEWTTPHKLAKLGWKVKKNPDHELSATKHLVRYLVPAGLVHPSRVL